MLQYPQTNSTQALVAIRLPLEYYTYPAEVVSFWVQTNVAWNTHFWPIEKSKEM